jgi:glycosyltransferase involved in cell wall biosynthesis
VRCGYPPPAGRTDAVTTVTLALSVVVPAHRNADLLRKALTALVRSDLPRQRWELIVVDDASGDSTPLVAAEHADTVLRLGSPPQGPAFARNRGAEAARGDTLVFVDADVAVHSGVLSGFEEHLARDRGLGAVFGAYDTNPPAGGLVSQYRNLVHHYVHARHAGPAVTFWAGCGAVRRDAFVQAGGFDERRYRRPQIEDIELGHRLADQGWRILLDASLQGTHLKRWTLLGGMRTDVRDRGVPWVELLLAERHRGGRSRALNFHPAEQLYAVLAALASAALVAAAVFRDGRWLLAAFAGLALVLAGNLPLLRWMAAQRGVGFALATVPLRLLYYLTSAWCVILGTVRHLARRGAPARGQPVIASSREPAQLES